MKNSFSYGLPSTEYSMKLSAGEVEGEGKGEPPTKFSRGGLTGSQFFEGGGVAGKEGVTFFKGLKFLQKKKNLKYLMTRKFINKNVFHCHN